MKNLSLDLITFEDFKQENGVCYWWARDLMYLLGYDHWDRFEKVVNRALKACMNLDRIKHYDEFRFSMRELQGEQVQDCKLTRFACFLVAMNGDSNLPNVALAQGYFAHIAEQQLDEIDTDDIDRLSIRKELAEGNKTLSRTFKRAGGLNYEHFNSAGFVGMYNAYKKDVARRKSIDPIKFYDRIGRAELAANLFRVTMTEERIKNQSVHGQRYLEQTHREVGQEIREVVKRNTGKHPEQLPASDKSIQDVQRILKQNRKELQAVDKPEKSKSKKKSK